MKSKWFVPVALVILLAGCLQSWKEFTSADGKFSVRMPGEPTEKSENLKTPVGDMAMHAILLKKGSTEYMVMYNDFPEAIATGTNEDALLIGARNGAAGGGRGKLMDDKSITLLGKYSGREIQVEMKDGVHGFRSRMYMVKNRLYQVAVAAPKEDLLSKDAEKFIESFKLIEK